MRERKYVKFRIDMYDDTKFKIIDRRPERDLIHYVWNRAVVLAGKVNQEGDLYLSKSIPYTIETLAIEFNRNSEEVKLALDVLIELEMLEFTENRIYRVKNFAKHQNIKVKEKIEAKDKEDNLKDKEIQVKENSKNESPVKVDKEAENKDVNKISHKESENVKKEEAANLEINQKAANKVDDNITTDKSNNNSQDIISMFLKSEKNKKGIKEKKEDHSIKVADEITETNGIDGFSDVERPLGKGECILSQFTIIN
jgi:predicted phage replisome organizer